MASKRLLKENLRRRRRRRVFCLLKVFLTSSSLALFALLALFYLPIFRVDKIAVEGNETASRGMIEEAAIGIMKERYFFLIPKDNFFVLPEDEIRSTLLSSFERIKEVKFEREFPDTLVIKVKERKPFALFCLGADGSWAENASNQSDDGSAPFCRFVDSGGFIFEDAALFSGDIYVKFFAQRQMKKIERFSEIMSFIKEATKADVHLVKVLLGNEELKLYDRRGWYLLLNKGEDMDKAASNLLVFLQNKTKASAGFLSELDYVDLRFGNKIYYKTR